MNFNKNCMCKGCKVTHCATDRSRAAEYTIFSPYLVLAFAIKARKLEDLDLERLCSKIDALRQKQGFVTKSSLSTQDRYILAVIQTVYQTIDCVVYTPLWIRWQITLATATTVTIRTM